MPRPFTSSNFNHEFAYCLVVPFAVADNVNVVASAGTVNAGDVQTAYVGWFAPGVWMCTSPLSKIVTVFCPKKL